MQRRQTNKLRATISISIVLFIIVGVVWIYLSLVKEEVISRYATIEQIGLSDITEPISFDGINDKIHLTSYAPFVNGNSWMYTGRGTSLPENYEPNSLVEVSVVHSLDEPMRVQSHINDDLGALFSHAADSGVSLIIASAYRSISTQKELYDTYVATRGQAAADELVATPGESEHHTGLAVDIDTYTNECELDSFSCTLTPEDGIWLGNNAWKHGFILRYPADKQFITGIQGETWHYRYVGKRLAELLYRSDMTFDEFIQRAAPGRMSQPL